MSDTLGTENVSRDLKSMISRKRQRYKGKVISVAANLGPI